MIKPYGERVLVKPSEDTKTKTGLYIPSGDKFIGKGIIVAGETGLARDMVVFFKKEDVTEIQDEGETYFIIDNDKILARK